jgi:hypothetical protein
VPKTHDRTSASQLKTAALCPRKWWFEKLSDLPKPEPTRALIEGSAIHKQVEDYLKHGTTPIDLRASALTKHYPPRSHGNGRLISEQEVNLSPADTGLAVPLLGFIDLVDLTALPHTLGIVDFKTVGDWKWAKTEEELRTDLQMVPYAVWALNTYKPNAVSVAHLQVHKATAQTAEVSAILDTRHTRKVWSETIVPLSHNMAEWATLEVTKVPAVVTACGAFGGCPYLSHCQRGQSSGSTASSPFAAIGRVKSSTTITNVNGETPMSKLQDLIRARAAARAVGTPALVAAPALEAAIAAVDAVEAAVSEGAPPAVLASAMTAAIKAAPPAVAEAQRAEMVMVAAINRAEAKATPAIDEVAFRLEGRLANAAEEGRESPYKEGSAKDLAWLEGWDSAAAEALEALRVIERAAQAEATADVPAPTGSVADMALVKEEKGFDYPLAAAAIDLALSKDFADGVIPNKDLRTIVGQALDLQRVAWSHVERACAAWPGRLTLKGLDLHYVAGEEEEEAAVEPPVVAPAVETPVVAKVEAGAAPAVETPAAVATETPAVVLPASSVQKGFALLVDVGIVVAPQGWTVQTMEAYLAPIIASYEKSTGGPAFLKDFRAGERTVAYMASLALPADGTLLLVDSMNGVWKEVSQALVPTAAFVLRGTR